MTVADADPRSARRERRRTTAARRAAASLDARPGAEVRLLPRRPSSGQRVRPRATARSGSSTSARWAGSTRSNRPRSSTCSWRSRCRDIDLLRESVERVADVTEQRRARATGASARAARGRSRPRQRRRSIPRSCRSSSRSMAAVRHPSSGRPRAAVAGARHARRHVAGDVTRRVAGAERRRDDGLDTEPLVDRDAMVKDAVRVGAPAPAPPSRSSRSAS